MAYNNRQDTYQETQYQSYPQQQNARYDRYNRNQHGNADGGRQQQYNHDYGQSQQGAYDHNQQYTQSYDQAYDQNYDQYGNQHPYYEDNSSGYNSAQAASQPNSQARQYQYDDRFRTNGHNAQPQSDRRNNTAVGRRSPQSSRPGTSASTQRPKQERILAPPKLESPKAMAWDSPFGVFPGTKKDLENKKKEADEVRSRSRAETPSDRPTTSSSSRANPAEPSSASRANQSFEQQRPHTSQGRQPQSPPRNFNSFNKPLGLSDGMPLRKKPPPPQQHQDFNRSGPQQTLNASKSTTNLGLPARPGPHRSTSGPLPETEPISPDPRTMPPLSYGSPPRNQAYQAREHQRNTHHRVQSREYDAPYEPSASHTPGGFKVQRNSVENKSQSNYKQPTSKGYGNLPYRGVDPSTQGAAPQESGMPNFAAMAPDATANVEREVTLQSKPVAYRKPTYGDASSKQAPLQTQMAPQTSENHDFIQSPIQDYKSVQQTQNRQQNAGYRSRDESQQQHNAQNNQFEGARRQQFPSQIDSRAVFGAQEPDSGFNEPYNQQAQRRRQDQSHFPETRRHGPMKPSYNQPSHAPRQEYGFDDQGYPQDHQYDNTYNHAYDTHHQQPVDTYQFDSSQGRQPLTRTHTEPVPNDTYDHYNHGYNQRDLNQPHAYTSKPYSNNAFQPPLPQAQHEYSQDFDQYGNAAPARPRTANSSRTPVREYPNHPMPISRPPNSGFPVADRNHPIPVRPGLMEPPSHPNPIAAPAQSVQVSPPRTVQPPAPNTHQQSAAPAKTPVTTQELNDLRVKFKDRPNDDKLGLHFAKKLVEAASVLASEGGKADAKTTAKNRERYINDAYRIVKKLVANNSVEATFYLADCYGSGQLGLEVNPREAFQLYTSAAKSGHAQSAYRVAVCCEIGPDGGGGTRRDHVKAVSFYRRAATLGDGPAMFKMGMILLKGLLGQQPNRRDGISWLKRAAERADEDNPHALHELALLYETAQSNDVLVRDERYALQLFTQAANLGYKYSQYRLGSAHEYGTLGVAIDPRQSIYWYTQAAKQGEHQSEFALSGWYLTGSEPLLSQSDAEAYLWARKAASSGLAKAEYAMGYYTEVGIGVTSNIEEAKKWYFRAAAQMDTRARERLEEIKRGGAKKEKTRISRSNVGKQNEGECVVM